MTGATTNLDQPSSLVRHARTFASLTLVSRVFGLGRDALLARALGLSAVGTAFNLAFQIPNTFRRLFGEGALSAAFIPEYSQRVKHDPELAHRVASLTLALLVMIVGAITIVAEAALALALMSEPVRQTAGPVITLTMIVLPYMPLICVTAALGGMLQVHGRFGPQAAAPIILNVCMISAVLAWSYAFGAGGMATAMSVGSSVLIAGVLQVAWCLWSLRRLVRWTWAWEGTRQSILRIARRMGPVIIGLGAVQISTLLDSFIAGYPVIFGPELPGGFEYPMDEGAGATLTFTQRLYQFPLGIFGIALATAALPLLSRQADDPPAFLATLRRTIRLSLFIGLPATVGLALVAEDATAVVYLGREVDEAGVARMARVLVMYAPLVGAYGLIHVLTRAFYAQGRTATPMRVSLVAITLGLTLNFVLMWPLGERGLALASSAAALVHLGALAWVLDRHLARDWGDRLLDGDTIASILRSTFMALVMAGVLVLGRAVWPRQSDPGYAAHGLRLSIDIGLGAIVYGALAWFGARQELRWLVERDSVEVDG